MLINYKQHDLLTKDNILKLLDERTIMEYYLCESVDLRQRYRNPFRTDNNPKCYFNYTKNNRLYFFDNAFPEYSFDCFKLVQLKFNHSFSKALAQINKDFNLNLLGNDTVINNTINILNSVNIVKPKIEKKIYTYSVKTRNYSQYDIGYWNNFNIDKSMLRKYKVHCVDSYVKYCNGKFVFHYKFDRKQEIPNVCYCYEATNINNELKVRLYLPNARYHDVEKWDGNFDNSIIQGYSQLPKQNKYLIITSSLKDIMTINSLNIPEISAIAFNSESTVITPDVLTTLRERFDYIYSFYDNDPSGINSSNKLYQQHNIPILRLNSVEKDPSDFLKNHSSQSLIDFIYEQITGN